MALIKKKVTEETVAEETKEVVKEVVSDNVENSVDTVDKSEDTTVMNDEEKEVISNGSDVPVANTRKLDIVNELLAHQFNIDDSFYLTKVADKGNSITLGFANHDYEVSIRLKDLAEMGIDDYIL